MFKRIVEFFKPFVKCDICNKNANLNRFKINNNWICSNCYKKIKYHYKEYSTKQLYPNTVSYITENSLDNLREIIFPELKEAKQKLCKENFQKKKEKIEKEFQEKLNSIPRRKIINSTESLSKRRLKDMPYIEFSKIRNGLSYKNISNFVVIDVETTGIVPAKDEILEISMIKYNDFLPVECMTTLLKPKKTIPEEASNINGITDDMCKDAPEIEYVIKSFYDFIGSYNIIGYNLEFDLKFLYKNGLDFFDKKRKFYDVLPLARKYIEYVDNYKLVTIAEDMEIYRNSAHESLSDCYTTALVYKKILDENFKLMY